MLILQTKNSIGKLNDEQFFQLCVENRDLKIEQNAQGQILIMPPTGGETGNRNSELLYQIVHWNKQNQLGFVFDSSTGFKLPSGATRSPDAAWIEQNRWLGLVPAQRKVFPPLCPDFVAEIKSPTDSLDELKAKMEEWIANGCRLAWLIDPETEKIYIYRPHQPLEIIDSFDNTISGGSILPNFIFDLKELRFSN